MAMLNFKMGLRNNLYDTAKAPITAGTVYVTTDERAMYIDIDESTRIRLGDFRIYTNFNALKDDKANWSTSALVFCEEENALARFNGTEWALINDTAALVKDITDLKTAVNAINNSETGILKQAKDYADAKVQPVANDLDALELVVGNANDTKDKTTIFGKIAKNADDIATNKKNIADLNAYITGGATGGSIGEVIDGKITAAVNALDSTVTSDNHDYLAIAITQTDGKLTGASITGDFDSKYDAKDAAKNVKDALDKEITDIKSAIGADGLAGRVSTLETNIPKTYETKSDATAKLNAAKDYSDDNLETAKAYTDALASGQVATNKTDIANLKTAVGTGTVANNIKNAIDALDSTIESATPETGKGLKITIEQVDGKLESVVLSGSFDNKYDAKGAGELAANAVKDELNGEISGIKSALTGANGINSKITALEGKLEGVTKVSTAISDAEGRAAQDATTKANKALTDAKAYTDELANGQVNTNKNNIADLQNALTGTDGVNSRISALETKVDVEKVSTAIATAKSGAEATAKGYADTAEANAKAEVTKLANGQVNTNKTNIADLTTKVNNVETAYKAADKAINDRIDAILNDDTLDSFADVKTFVNNSIAANDAMVFMGVVDSTHPLPTSGMENGDTYKVAESGTYNGTEAAKQGDLYIYDGHAKEWRLIPSGNENYNDATLSSNGNVIELKSGMTTKKDSVTIAGKANSPVKVEGNGANNIVISLEWGTF